MPERAFLVRVNFSSRTRSRVECSWLLLLVVTETVEPLRVVVVVEDEEEEEVVVAVDVAWT